MRGCHHEVSLSLHRTAHCSYNYNQKWVKGTWHQVPELSALLTNECLQLLYDFPSFIGFPLVSTAAVGLSSGNETCSLCKLAILSGTKFPILETHFSLNFFTTCFPILWLLFSSEFLLHIPTLKCRESSSLYWFCLFSFTIPSHWNISFISLPPLPPIRENFPIFISSPDLLTSSSKFIILY